MSNVERPPVRRRRWLLLLLLAIAAAPLGIAWYDWAQAVRTARDDAAGVAWTKAAGGFLGREWPHPLKPGVTMTVSQSPPQAGAFAGYAYAVHAETAYEWQPIFHRLIGGPYLIQGRATAAIVRDESGKWTPMMVE